MQPPTGQPAFTDQDVLYVRYHLEQGLSTSAIAQKLAARLPNPDAAIIQAVISSGQAVFERTQRASTVDPDISLASIARGQTGGRGTALVESLISIEVPGEESLVRTVRSEVPFDITLEEYRAQLAEKIAEWNKNYPGTSARVARELNVLF